MFRFIHAADIHLDSPLRGLESYEDAPVEEIRNATRRAFDNLVTLAIEEEVSFILLAGDLYDGDWKDYNTGLFFTERMGRLKRQNIRVFMVSGNHDAASRISRHLHPPDNVTVLSTRKPETILLNDIGAAIMGQGYASRAVTQNLVKDYPQYHPGYFNIGLLHTALNGREGHEPYAPCSLDDQLLLGGCLLADDGNELSFLRRKRRKTDLFDAHDNPLGPEALTPFISGMDQDEFETLFGIDHEALVQGGRDILAQKGEVGQALFSAGAGIASLKEILGALDAEADELFRPRASTKGINQALGEYKKLQKDIRAATLSGQEWINVERNLQKIQTELASVEQGRREKDMARRQLERLKQALPQLALRRRYLDRLKNLGDADSLPHDFSKRRRKAMDNLHAAQQAHAAAVRHLSALREKQQSIWVHPSLVEASEWIEALNQKLGSHRKAMKDRPQLEGMRIGCKSEAAALLKQVPTDIPLEGEISMRFACFPSPFAKPYFDSTKIFESVKKNCAALKKIATPWRMPLREP